jgi:hypothetical protein
MTNGLGAGFAALTMLAVLGGLALLALLTTVASWALHLRTGRVPAPVRHLLVLVGVAVLGIGGFALVAFADEAPLLSGLFTALVVVPLLVAAGFLARTTDLAPLDVGAVTVMAWALPFLLGVVVTFGTTTGVRSALGITSTQARQMGVRSVAAAIAGLVVVLGTGFLGGRFVSPVRSGPDAGEP